MSAVNPGRHLNGKRNIKIRDKYEKCVLKQRHVESIAY